jgi:hypothetical protein
MEILFEKEVIKHLGLPSIPKKQWNGKDSFKDGVAILELFDDSKAYAVCTFDKESDKEPRIKKVFCVEPFKAVGEIYVVPSYMDNDTTDADLDSESKRKAEQLAAEAMELENEGTVDEAIEEANKLPEWIFPEIQNIEQAQAYLREYNRMNGIKKGKVPTNEETIKMRLYNIYMSQKNRK